MIDKVLQYIERTLLDVIRERDARELLMGCGRHMLHKAAEDNPVISLVFGTTDPDRLEEIANNVAGAILARARDYVCETCITGVNDTKCIGAAESMADGGWRVVIEGIEKPIVCVDVEHAVEHLRINGATRFLRGAYGDCDVPPLECGNLAPLSAEDTADHDALQRRA